MPIELKNETNTRAIDPKLDKCICFITVNWILPVHKGKLSTMRRVVNDKTLEILMMLGLSWALPETHLTIWVN